MTLEGRPEAELSALQTAFGSLSASQIVKFRRVWEMTSVDPGDTFDLHDGLGKRLALCVAGYVCVERYPSGKGRPRCLCILSPGEVAGLALLAGQPDVGRPEAVLALTPASLLVTSPDAVTLFLRAHPDAYADITAVLARELAMQQLRLERDSSEPIVSNLAFLLLMLSMRFGSSGRSDVLPKELTARRWLAMFLGVSLESLQRALRALRSEGLVSTTHAEVRILDRRRLREKANVDDAVLALFEPLYSTRGCRTGPRLPAWGGGPPSIAPATP